jgi:hypothetical protein
MRSSFDLRNSRIELLSEGNCRLRASFGVIHGCSFRFSLCRDGY